MVLALSLVLIAEQIQSHSLPLGLALVGCSHALAPLLASSEHATSAPHHGLLGGVMMMMMTMMMMIMKMVYQLSL